MAPSFSVIASSGTMSSGSIACLVPSPSHSGQAPKGLLKEKSRGSISEMVKPETGQANFSENRMRSCVSFFDLLAESPVSCSGCQRLVGEFGDGDAVGDAAAPSPANPPAACRYPRRTTTRSTTMSMSCFSFLSSAGASAIS